MSKDCVLGIDIGTSGVRIVASDRNGALLAMSKAPIIAPIQDSGRSLQDPKIWWTAIEQAFTLLDLKSLNVLALAIDGTSGTILAVDESGTPLGLASMYNDLAERADVVKVYGCTDGDRSARRLIAAGARSSSCRQAPPASCIRRIGWPADSPGALMSAMKTMR